MHTSICHIRSSALFPVPGFCFDKSLVPLRAAGETLVDEIGRGIGQMIRTGSIKPGEHLLTSIPLAAHFDVGLSTVSEAIQTLSGLWKLASREDDDTLVDADLAFHLADVRASKNELLEHCH